MCTLQSEGVLSHTLGVKLPILARCAFGGGGRTGRDRPDDGLPAVAVASHTQGDHGVQADLIYLGPMFPQILRMGQVGRSRITCEQPLLLFNGTLQLPIFLFRLGNKPPHLLRCRAPGRNINVSRRPICVLQDSGAPFKVVIPLSVC